MFEEFPKERQPLPGPYQAILQKHYLENREGLTRSSSITKLMESWMHAQIAADVHNKPAMIKPTLEIGAGTLNHLSYEKNIQPYDIVEPNEALLMAFPERRNNIRSLYADIFQVPTEARYDRVISIATFEHLEDLPAVISKTALLLNEGGNLRIAIPNEGCWLWKLGYQMTSGVEFWLRHRLDYQKIMAYEHVNTASDIEDVLKYFFATVECRVMGLTKQAAFYRFYSCLGPNRERCASFLKERNINS